MSRHCAADLELPAVIDATDSAFFVASERERGATVGAGGIDYADASVGVAKGDEILIEKSDPSGGTIGFADLFGQARRHPVSPKHLAGGRFTADAREATVILGTQHLIEQASFDAFLLKCRISMHHKELMCACQSPCYRSADTLPDILKEELAKLFRCRGHPPCALRERAPDG